MVAYSVAVVPWLLLVSVIVEYYATVIVSTAYILGYYLLLGYQVAILWKLVQEIIVLVPSLLNELLNKIDLLFITQGGTSIEHKNFSHMKTSVC